MNVQEHTVGIHLAKAELELANSKLDYIYYQLESKNITADTKVGELHRKRREGHDAVRQATNKLNSLNQELRDFVKKSLQERATK